MEEQQVLQIICLQTSLTEYHYQSYSILKEYFLQRIHRLRTSPSTLLILPECVGIWLYLMCVPMPEFLRDYFFNHSESQFNRHVLFILYTLITHLRLFLKEIYRNYHSKSTWLGWIQRAWFSLFAEQSYTIYERLFSELARETHCIIVAGSIFLQEENLYNISCVFEPNNGSICLRTGKQYPVADEIDFINPYTQLPSIYSIPKTNIDMAVLICADSWMPEVYEQYNRRAFHANRRFLFVIVALNTGEWNIPWPGYDRHVTKPNDVKPEHLQEYSLPTAWFHYAVNRGFDVLSKRSDLVGYGVICCQGILNIMNDIHAEGESMIILQRSKNDEKIFLRAKSCIDEEILTCQF